MSIQPPPTTNEITDKNQLATLPWILFFNQMFIGDTGASWTPTFTSLTVTGTPTITGRYYKLSQSICYFRVHIVPATNTSATAGTTYVNNFPLTPAANGICFAVSGNLGSNSGQVATDGKIYVPTWTTVTVPLTILGIVEAT